MRIQTLTHGLIGSLVLASAVFGAACEKKSDETVTKTTEPSPVDTSTRTNAGAVQKSDPKVPGIEMKDPLKAAHADMKKVLDELGSLGGKPLSTLTAAEARKQPTPADAVKSLLMKEKKSTAPLEMAKVDSKKIPGAAGQIDVRLYTPKPSAGLGGKDGGPLPIVVYYHGGGFVIADLETYDASARALAKESGAIVVSADYRHAPENKFPAAHDDAFAAYQWVLANAGSFNGDGKRVAVAGESAGGNLAINVSIMARDKGVQMPLHQVLVYPMAQTTMMTDSYLRWEKAVPLDKASMSWFFQNTIKSDADKADPRLDLLHANLKGLPKTTVILAEIDPLNSDGLMLVKALDDAKVPVDRKEYEGVTHEFFGMGAAVGDAKDAESYAGGRLKNALLK